MGEVYRAHDLTLERNAAIKVLPAALAADPDRLMRVECEARMLAALNHPQIAAIYGVEESDDTRALVRELVEGRTLSDLIAEASGPPARPRRGAGGHRCEPRVSLQEAARDGGAGAVEPVAARGPLGDLGDIWVMDVVRR